MLCVSESESESERERGCVCEGGREGGKKAVCVYVCEHICMYLCVKYMTEGVVTSHHSEHTIFIITFRLSQGQVSE